MTNAFLDGEFATMRQHELRAEAAERRLAKQVRRERRERRRARRALRTERNLQPAPRVVVYGSLGGGRN